VARVSITVRGTGLVVAIIAGTRLTVPVTEAIAAAATIQVTLIRAIAVAIGVTALVGPFAIGVLAIDHLIAIVVHPVLAILFAKETSLIAVTGIAVGVDYAVVRIAVVAVAGLTIPIAETAPCSRAIEVALFCRIAITRGITAIVIALAGATAIDRIAHP